jgi:putative Mg2+ transporter-C (MgtC) family protein
MGTWWERAAAAAAEDFSDLPDAAAFTRLVLRLLLAAALGGALGYEREREGKAAGMRTHMLVALGAALFVLVPQQTGVTAGDMTRVLQGLIAGIGFLGAGTILKGERESEVKGLTTAAGIWLTAAIGVTVGLGREATALLSTALALGILALLPHGPNREARLEKDDGPKGRIKV